ncbi:MAG: protein translocase subunit yajC [Fibrobacteria bacterium]|nr:protein translocase subunit yajC [Fibrobacteria bacterium]
MGFGKMDLVFLLGTILVMYFLFFLPQRKKQQALTKMLAGLKRGDQVATTSGMRGEVVAVTDTVVTLKFHDNVRIDFDKAAIVQVIAAETPAAS